MFIQYMEEEEKREGPNTENDRFNVKDQLSQAKVQMLSKEGLCCSRVT